MRSAIGSITPAVMPLDRGVFEDAIVAELGGMTDVMGGGTLLGDPPVSDFTIDTRSERSATDLAAIVWRVLGSVSLTLPTVFTVRIDGIDHPRPPT